MPILTEKSWDLITHSASQTYRLGEQLGRLVQPGDVVCLQGDLGSGKTCLTQGIGAGMQVDGIISSPTFVFINEHKPRNSGPYLYHVDLYRIDEYTAAFALGIEDYIYGDGVTVIEWAERANELMPAERLWITLAYLEPTKRCLSLDANGPRYLALLSALKAAVFAPKSQRPRTEEA
jgi:tRNA threonylcarbamoyladenosine biosynthesis protein TsaE